MPLCLRVGVIGLGRTWHCYLPALHGLRDRFDVRCVYDPRPERCAAVARGQGCSVAGGVVDLLDRPEVEALLLLDRAWFGLWPVTQACRLGKPVFCASSLVHDDAHADGLRETVAAGTTPVVMGLSLTAAPALVRLRELLRRRLGPARLVRCDWTAPRRHRSGSEGAAVHALFHECASLFDAAPESVWATGTNAADFGSVLLEFGQGRVAQVNRWTGARTACHVQVVAEKGTAEAELPGDLRWRDREGRHSQRLAAHSGRLRLLERFFLVARNGEKPQPDLDGAHRALTWLRAAVRSRDEGRKVILG
jgi:predicted dehydrogenase